MQNINNSSGLFTILNVDTLSDTSPPINSTDIKISNINKRKSDESLPQPRSKKAKITLTNVREGIATETKADGSTVTFKFVNNIREGKAILWDPRVGTTTFIYEHGIKQGPAYTKLLNGVTLNYSFKNNVPYGEGTATFENRSLTCLIANGKLNCSEANLKKLMEPPLSVLNNATDKTSSSLEADSNEPSLHFESFEMNESEFLTDFSDYIGQINAKKND